MKKHALTPPLPPTSSSLRRRGGRAVRTGGPGARHQGRGARHEGEGASPCRAACFFSSRSPALAVSAQSHACRRGARVCGGAPPSTSAAAGAQRCAPPLRRPYRRRRVATASHCAPRPCPFSRPMSPLDHHPTLSLFRSNTRPRARFRRRRRRHRRRASAPTPQRPPQIAQSRRARRFRRSRLCRRSKGLSQWFPTTLVTTPRYFRSMPLPRTLACERSLSESLRRATWRGLRRAGYWPALASRVTDIYRKLTATNNTHPSAPPSAAASAAAAAAAAAATAPPDVPRRSPARAAGPTPSARRVA